MVFNSTGLDAPVLEIAEKEGIRVDKLYRHFPQCADLIAAVFRREVNVCVNTAPLLIAWEKPFDTPTKWIRHDAAFIATKRGLAPALHWKTPRPIACGRTSGNT